MYIGIDNKYYIVFIIYDIMLYTVLTDNYYWPCQNALIGITDVAYSISESCLIYVTTIIILLFTYMYL